MNDILNKILSVLKDIAIFLIVIIAMLAVGIYIDLALDGELTPPEQIHE